MPRFFLQASNISDDTITVSGDDANHISRSLRMKKGEHITVCDMQKIEYDCVIEDFTDSNVIVKIVSQKPSDTEPPHSIILYQALPKSDKMDVIIQKAVESGVSEIVTFESERTIAKADVSKEENKLKRRNRISLEAAKQCGRAYIPRVMPTESYASVLKEAQKCDIKLFFYEGDGTVSLRDYLMKNYPREKQLDNKSIAIIIGAEGGFSLKETQMAVDAGFTLCGLGKRILRCETASSFVLACLAFWFEL